MKKHPGNIGEVMITGLCILAMTVVMLSYMENVQLIQKKTEMGQLARKYILRMETVGQLTDQDRNTLTRELQELGVTDIDYTGSTLEQTTYGMPVTLQICGKLGGKYVVSEKRMSTSKN